MRITYGKNVYGKEEISAVVKQLKKTTQMSDSVRGFEKKIAKIFGKKYGLMVNYLYKLDKIEENHESYTGEGKIKASSNFKRLLKN